MAFRYIDYDSNIRTNLDDKNVWNVLYPIGSIYLTTTDKSPTELFPTPSGFTWKWELLSGGYLYATSGNPVAGSKGGSDEIKLEVSNLPAHHHKMDHTHTRGSMDITGRTPYFNTWSLPGSWSGAFQWTGNHHHPNGYHSGSDDCWREADFVASRTWTGETSQPNNEYTDYAGSGEAIKITPKYISVYCWRRIE